MYSLILWSKGKKVSVIEEKLISGCNEENGKVKVKYGGRSYTGTVLRKNEDKKYLDCLNVTTSGKVLAKDKQKLSSAVLAEKTDISSQARYETSGRKELKKHRDQELLSVMHGDEDISEVKKVSEDIEMNSEDTEEDALKNKISDNCVETSAVSVESVCLSNDATKPQECEVCLNFPTASAENLKYFIEVANFMTRHYERHLRVSLIHGFKDTTTETSAETELIKMGHCISGYKEELSLGSGVFAPRQFLSDLKRDYRHKPSEMVRRLFKLLVRESKLAKCSALGEKCYPGVPADIREAIQAWVDKNCSKSEVLPNSKYIRVINLMCGTLRNPKNKDKPDQKDFQLKQGPIEKRSPAKARNKNLRTEGSSPLDTIKKKSPAKVRKKILR